MTTDPFDNILGPPKTKQRVEAEYEVVNGALSCQTTGCYEVSHEGKYFTEEQLLSWICSKGHVSYIRDFVC